MLRTTLLTGVVTLLGAVSALAIGPRIEAHRVEGYLDRAPAGAQVVQQLKIGRGAESRVVYITESQSLEASETCSSCAAMYGSAGSFSVVGDGKDVEKLMQSPAGAKISAVFSRPRSDRHMLVQDVMTKDDGKTVAEIDGSARVPRLDSRVPWADVCAVMLRSVSSRTTRMHRPFPNRR